MFRQHPSSQELRARKALLLSSLEATGGVITDGIYPIMEELARVNPSSGCGLGSDKGKSHYCAMLPGGLGPFARPRCCPKPVQTWSARAAALHFMTPTPSRQLRSVFVFLYWPLHSWSCGVRCISWSWRREECGARWLCLFPSPLAAL